MTRSLGVFLQSVTRGMTQAFGRERILFQSTKDPGFLHSTPNIDSILRVCPKSELTKKGLEILPHVNGPFGTIVREGPFKQYPKLPPTFPSFTPHPLIYNQDAVYLPPRPSDELLSHEHRAMAGEEILGSSLPKRVCLEGEVPAEHPESATMLGEMEGSEAPLLGEMEGTGDVNGSLGLLLTTQPPMEFPMAHRGNREESQETTHFEPTMYESMLNGGNQVSEVYMDENAGILNTMTHGEEEIRSRETVREEPLSEEGEGNSDTAVWVGIWREFHLESIVFRVSRNSVPPPVPGFSYYALMRFGVGVSLRRKMIELLLDLPFHRVAENSAISHLPPWSLFLTLTPSRRLTVTCVFGVSFIADSSEEARFCLPRKWTTICSRRSPCRSNATMSRGDTSPSSTGTRHVT